MFFCCIYSLLIIPCYFFVSFSHYLSATAEAKEELTRLREELAAARSALEDEKKTTKRLQTELTDSRIECENMGIQLSQIKHTSNLPTDDVVCGLGLIPSSSKKGVAVGVGGSQLASHSGSGSFSGNASTSPSSERLSFNENNTATHPHIVTAVASARSTVASHPLADHPTTSSSSNNHPHPILSSKDTDEGSNSDKEGLEEEVTRLRALADDLSSQLEAAKMR